MAYQKQTAFSVHVINPRKKSSGSRRKRRSKKTTTAKPRKKAAKKAAAKAPSRKKAEPKMAKKRRKKTTRRRSTRGASTTRRITRRNPTRRRRAVAAVRRTYKRARSTSGVNAVVNEMKSALPRMLGMLAAGWAVRRWSQTAGGVWSGQAHTSPTMGEGWSLPQYAIAGAVAMWGPGLVKKFVNPTEFRRGVVDLMVQKFVWTEGIARSPALQTQFGAGDVAYQGNQAYVDSGGRWNAMQGLVESSPLDGLVESSALDGPDGVSAYGHLMAPGTGTAAGKYHGSGFESNYHAAFHR